MVYHQNIRLRFYKTENVIRRSKRALADTYNAAKPEFSYNSDKSYAALYDFNSARSRPTPKASLLRRSGYEGCMADGVRSECLCAFVAYRERNDNVWHYDSSFVVTTENGRMKIIQAKSYKN